MIRWQRVLKLQGAALAAALPLVAAHDRDAQAVEAKTVSVFSTFTVLTTTSWSKTTTGSRDAADGTVMGGATDAWTIKDTLVPAHEPIKIRLTGKGDKCRFRIAVYDGAPQYGAYTEKPAVVWHTTAPNLPHDYEMKPSYFFNMGLGPGWTSRKIVVTPTNHGNHTCTGPSASTEVTFVQMKSGDHALIKSIHTNPIHLQQTWPGPKVTGKGFSFLMKGAGYTSGPVDVTLSAPGIKSHTAKVTPGPQTVGQALPALVQGTDVLAAFPELVKLSPGAHMFDVSVKPADHVMYGSATGHVLVVVAPAPPPKGRRSPRSRRTRPRTSSAIRSRSPSPDRRAISARATRTR